MRCLARGPLSETSGAHYSRHPSVRTHSSCSAALALPWHSQLAHRPLEHNTPGISCSEHTDPVRGRGACGSTALPRRLRWPHEPLLRLKSALHIAASSRPSPPLTN